jgi:hypothetical protein
MGLNQLGSDGAQKMSAENGKSATPMQPAPAGEFNGVV